jgi:hypothetical protein
MPDKPHRVVSNIFEQYRRAAEWEEAEIRRLRREGWVWHPNLQFWSHPDKPGTIISH